MALRGDGLYRFDVGEDRWTRIVDEENHLNGAVYGILEDDHGNLWMSSNNGLYRYNIESGKFMRFTAEHGIQGNEFNRNSYMKMPDGRMYFGGMMGLTSFHPEQLNAVAINQPLVLNDFSAINENDVLESKLLKGSDVNSGIYVTYWEAGLLEFKYSWFSFNLSESNLFEYQLAGYNDFWIDNENKTSATFTNVPPGEYTFKVRSKDWKGSVNKSELSIPVFISPPWWQTWWAYSLYTFFAISIAVVIFRFRLRRIQLKNEVLFNQNEAQRFKELETAKSLFFSNITHEFKTPLTLILGPLEQLSEKLNGSDEKSIVKTARRNAIDLLRLINQLLDLNKIEQGKMEVKYSHGDLVLFISDLCKNVAPYGKSHNIKVDFTSNLKEYETNFDRRKTRTHGHQFAEQCHQVLS